MPHQPFNYLRFIIICLVILAVAFVLASVSAPDRTAGDNMSYRQNPGSSITPGVVSVNNASLLPSENADDPTMGPADALVTIYEFADFGCQYSAQMQPIISDIMKRYDGQVRLVFKYTPSDVSYPAHLAAYCANKQGKFRPYAELLWSDQSDFSRSRLDNLANQAGLDMASFKTCVDSDAGLAAITADSDEADRLEIFATPHLYINNQEVIGMTDEAAISSIIDNELK